MKEVEHENLIYYIGKNKEDNDKMFDKMASDMTWFHLEETSSAHVYVHLPKERIKHRKALKHAARLVRENSHANGYQKVCYVLKKHLKKGSSVGELEFNPEFMKIV